MKIGLWVMAFIVKSRIGELMWADLLRLVQEAETSGAESKSKWVLERLTLDNASKWLKNLALEVAVGYVFNRT